MQKRSLTLGGHRTSVALEPEFWSALAALADARGLPLAHLVAEIDRERGEEGLASAVRVHLIEHFRQAHEERPRQALSDPEHPDQEPPRQAGRGTPTRPG